MKVIEQEEQEVQVINNNSDSQLKQYIEKIELLENERLQVLEQTKEVFDEAKANGFDIPTMRKIIRLKKLKPEDLEEQDSLLETYRNAIGL